MARPRSEEANAKILKAAVELLFEVGLDGFTVDEVAARSGVAKTTIYRHFSSGSDLLVTALDSTVRPFPTPDTGSLRDDLLEFMAMCVPVFANPQLRPLMLGIVAAAATDAELDRIQQALLTERKMPLRAIIDTAKERGQLSESLVFEDAFDFVEGPLLARWMQCPETLTDLDIGQLVDRIVAALSA